MLGIPFTVKVSKYTEDHSLSNIPEELVLLHAVNKATEVAGRMSKTSENHLILSADTLVVCGKEILGKPTDRKDARRMLRMLSGKTHTVMTALHMIRMMDGKHISHVEKTAVEFDTISESEIESYLYTNEWTDKAGAYAAQGKGAVFIKKIEGDFFNVVGMPVRAFLKMYREIILS